MSRTIGKYDDYDTGDRKRVDAPLALANSNPMLIGRGLIDGTLVVNKFGGNTSVADGVREDVWDGGGTYSFPSTAAITHIRQVADQAAMRGATIELQGLDASWALTVQTKALDGSDTSTLVEIDTPLIRIFRMKVLADVVGDENIQALSATSPEIIYSQMTAGNNQTLQAIYTVPVGYTAMMTSYYASTTESTGKEPKSTEISLWTADRSNGYEFQLKHAMGIPKAGAGVQHRFEPHFKIGEKTDIKIAAEPNNEDASVHAGFDLTLYAN